MNVFCLQPSVFETLREEYRTQPGNMTERKEAGYLAQPKADICAKLGRSWLKLK